MVTEANIDIPTIVIAGRTETLALAEYRDKPTIRERLYNFQEAHWNVNRLAAGLAKSDVVVDDVPYSEAQMGHFGKDFGLFLPYVFSTDKKGLGLLGKVYPQMRWDVQPVTLEVVNVDQEGNPFSLFGWMRTEKVINAPYTKKDEEAAEKVIGSGRLGQTLNVYAEAGNQSKLLTGKYLDEVSTWVRVLRSRAHGQVVSAYFAPDGRCHVHWPLRADHVHPDLAVRSVGI